MKSTRILYHNYSPIQADKKEIKGNIISLDGADYYKISNYDQMSTFFMSVVSSSDHWMYISSNGGLTCGRRSPENALFPYYTDDKIHDSAENTGPLTILLVSQNNKTYFWKPFSKEFPVYNIERNIYKSIYGNKILFEELNHDLGVSFSYSWMNSEKYGFIRNSKIRNINHQSKNISFIDGLRNILPYGINKGLQDTMSTLVDGYKQSELIESVGLAIYTLSSILTDKAEPSEALKSTVVWQQGLSNAKYLLSEEQLNTFIQNNSIETEHFIKGKRGSFFINGDLKLSKNSTSDWFIIADLEQSSSDLPALIKEIKEHNLKENLIEDVSLGTKKLHHLIFQSDGIQFSADKLTSSRHLSNTLFNIMRGGIFNDEYDISKDDFIDFISKRNKTVFTKHESLFQSLKNKENRSSILEIVTQAGDPDLIRLTYEYLPLIFSRRHGDPSRPWNSFSIDIKKVDGGINLDYQGNWRDIFQNWEALSLSYPEYIESFIAKFLNASTPDGYNPYRITKDGIDWEILDPEDPWSNIGYWGDHQIIYLLKLLELSHKYHPGILENLLNQEIFVYANVPYRIKDYDSLLMDPRNTIFYDKNLADLIHQKVVQLGSDGKLVQLHDEEIYKVNLSEKILLSALSKLGNFVPGGGIWMNTQRPEWNDANNALVGFGISMVTLYYLRRYLKFIKKLFSTSATKEINISKEIKILFDDIYSIFKKNINVLKKGVDDESRKTILDRLGKASENYRICIYNGFSGIKVQVNKDELDSFLSLALSFLDQTIKMNKREDGIYHAYNLLHFGDQGYQVEHLYEMLEGQVAVLSSGFLDTEECFELLITLKNSKIFRKDQHSYMLYPDKKLPRFLEKNNIPESKVKKVEWLVEQIKNEKFEVLEQDVNGQYHFNGLYRNSADLRSKLQEDTTITYEEIDVVCNLYEEQFNHKQFTGRSGTFYKYEGLGCIYWHMVSKLLLAVQEIWQTALKANQDKETLRKLYKQYKDIKEGIGLHKNPGEYGAFPIDPYSHTPSFSGVQQPGMTGQVKEDLINRFYELGICISDGRISFNPTMLTKMEFSKEEVTYKLAPDTSSDSIKLPKKSLAFTICKVPVIYVISNDFRIVIETIDNETIEQKTNVLDLEISQSVFRREGFIQRIIVELPENIILE